MQQSFRLLKTKMTRGSSFTIFESKTVECESNASSSMRNCDTKNKSASKCSLENDCHFRQTAVVQSCFSRHWFSAPKIKKATWRAGSWRPFLQSYWKGAMECLCWEEELRAQHWRNQTAFPQEDGPAWEEQHLRTRISSLVISKTQGHSEIRQQWNHLCSKKKLFPKKRWVSQVVCIYLMPFYHFKIDHQRGHTVHPCFRGYHPHHKWVYPGQIGRETTGKTEEATWMRS